ncbi:MAG: hypothetical protein Q4F84_07145 [Fibrobacter sp.]|nr:hypothetical protein [Fibrobacter sp.]
MKKPVIIITGVFFLLFGIYYIWACIRDKTQKRDIHGVLNEKSTKISKIIHYSTAIETIFVGAFLIWLGIVYNE